MGPVLQTRLPFTPWADPALRRLPGIQPAEPALAFAPDEAYAGQMALRDALIAAQCGAVLACLPEAERAAEELLGVAFEEARRLPGFSVGAAAVKRPDGVRVARDGAPLAVLGRIFQQDFCLMQKAAGSDEHVLTGAVLCFPAGWTLAEKIGRPLLRVHAPVPAYDAGLGRRVERLFEALRPGRALWRANAHFCAAPELWTPLREADPKPVKNTGMPYLRSERQVLFRLPESDAVVFSIHTIMVKRTALDAEQLASLGS